MTTIPQVSATMQKLLTTTATAAGGASGFVQRASPLDGASFTQTLVFGFLANADAALEELAQTAATLGVPVSSQALDQRFTPTTARSSTRRGAPSSVAAARNGRTMVHSASVRSVPSAVCASSDLEFRCTWRKCTARVFSSYSALQKSVRSERGLRRWDVGLGQPDCAAAAPRRALSDRTGVGRTTLWCEFGAPGPLRRGSRGSHVRRSW